MSLSEYIPLYNPDPYEDLIAGLETVRGSGDAIALMPYDDGTFWPKPAYFDKELLGGIGGFETDDGDKIAVDGTGEAIRSLFGIDIVLAVDPTEHAGAVDPIKALVAHKHDIGEWIRVDRKGQTVQIGPAMEPPPFIVDADDVEDAMAQASDDELLALLFGQEYDPEEYDADEKLELVATNDEAIKERIAAGLEQHETPSIDSDGFVTDKGMVRDRVQETQEDPHQEQLGFTEALAELRANGDVSTVYDIAPPAGITANGNGELDIEQATHIAVDQSKAADLLPRKWDTTKLNTMMDKARMEEYDEGQLVQYFTYGIIVGAVISVVLVMLIGLMTAVGGGIF